MRSDAISSAIRKRSLSFIVPVKSSVFQAQQISLNLFRYRKKGMLLEQELLVLVQNPNDDGTSAAAIEAMYKETEDSLPLHSESAHMNSKLLSVLS